MQRDYVGYGSLVPDFTWPDKKRLAINVVVNFEEGSEYSLAFGDDRQEDLAEWGLDPFPPGVRHLANESMFEYGTRVGVWRLLEMFEALRIPVTFGACAVALERNAAATKAIVAAGHEICSHGYRWEEHFRMTREEERERIRLAVRTFVDLVGERPLGWYCRTSPSVNTRELLVEEGGFVYDSDAYNDDLPYFVRINNQRHLVVPYTGDVNDTHYWHSPGYETGFFQYLKDSFDYLYAESHHVTKMMSIGLHLRIIGRPGRAQALKNFLAYASSQPGVWFTRRIDIAQHFIRQFPE